MKKLLDKEVTLIYYFYSLGTRENFCFSFWRSESFLRRVRQLDQNTILDKQKSDVTWRWSNGQ